MVSATKTLSAIVQENFRTADIFKKYGLNYCCTGAITLKEACRLRQLDCNMLVTELEEAIRIRQVSNQLRFDQWNLDFLIDYIINVHHAYLFQAVPALQLRLASFLKGHQKKYPELTAIEEAFTPLAEALLHHNQYEESTLFPYLKQVHSAYRNKEAYGHLFVRTLRKPLQHVNEEHAHIYTLLQQLKISTNHFTFPQSACTNHQVLYHKLHELFDDMMQHKHLENNILFPKAAEMEQQLLQL